jgi:hypothetical protein
MTDVKLEDAERLAIELRVVSRMLSRDLKDAAAFSCDKAAALLRKIPELQKEIHYLKMPFSAIEKEFTSEGLDTNIAMNALCKRAESHRKHIARLEQQLAERSAELEAERTRAHNLAEYIRERV